MLNVTYQEILTQWHIQGALWLMDDMFLKHHQRLISTVIWKAEEDSPSLQELLVDAVNMPYVDVRAAAARSPFLPIAYLAVLAADKERYVRQRVAQNPNTPAHVLAILAYDKDHNITQWVVRNPNTCAEALQYLEKNTNSYVRQRASQRLQEIDRLRARIRESEEAE